MRFARDASRQRREEFPLSRLHVGLECGGSDTTSGLASNPSIGVVADAIVAAGGTATITETSEFFGAEELFAVRGATPEVQRKILDTVRNHEADILAMGIDLRGSNPSHDNIRGGLTTIEEKALGAIAKSGTSQVVDVLAYGEVPAKTGLHLMAGPAPAVESITGLASGGCQICLFSTGVGNPIGHQVTTVVKVSGNRNTLSSMPENIDFDVSGILEKDESIEAVGERLLDYVVAVCSGEQTTSELLDTRESAISRFGISM